MSSDLYDKTRRKRSLIEAWKVVHENGITSKSATTRRQITKFSEDADRHLARINRQLSQKRFQFLPSTGILQKKPGKTTKRPIVKSPIENRIVQRAILDTLQSHPPLKSYFTVNSSFGGIKSLGVSDALKAVYSSMENGAKYFIRSDIESFFTKIPKPTVISIVEKTTSDNDFLGLFKDAINIELANLDELGKNKNIFPIYDIGVAQGSCLSPLLGNILLNEFDIEMNRGDITCIRYIDDFIILAPSKKAAHAAFKRALLLLHKHDLCAYNPKNNKDKSEEGEISAMFSFLGCDIKPGLIRPNKKSQKRFLSTIDEIISRSIELMNTPEVLIKNHRTVTETLNEISNIAKGWGNQYSYCNDYHLLERMDKSIDDKISQYLSMYASHRARFQRKGQVEQKRRLLGVHLLTDSKLDPIIK